MLPNDLAFGVQVHDRQPQLVHRAFDIEHGRENRQFLEANGYAPEYHGYAMPHAVYPEVIADLQSWLNRVLPAR